MEDNAILPHEPWSTRLAEQLERMRDAADGDTVHDMRVAAGRLSVWVEISGRRALHDDLRWLRRSAARLRDIDVMLETQRPPEWEAVLREQRDTELARVRKALDSTRPRALLEALACIPPPEVGAARKGARHLVHRSLRAAERMSEDESDPHALHRLRRRLRRLRYALDWLGEDPRDVKKVQDALGAFNDRVVELRHLDAHPIVRVPDDLVEELRDGQDRLRKTALESWAKHKKDVEGLARNGGALGG
jgi:CHAD domain-containing protein